MIDQNDPLKDGLTPPDYDEYGDGPNPENAPENVPESFDDEDDDNPGESPLG